MRNELTNPHHWLLPSPQTPAGDGGSRATAGPDLWPRPRRALEVTTTKPYLGTSVAGKYARTATDPVQGDISGAIQTYLAATNAPIALATYVFPLGTTNITNAVTNSRGLTAQQTVAITAVDTTRPALSVGNDVLVVQPHLAPLKTVQYPNRVRAHRLRGTKGEVRSLPCAARGVVGRGRVAGCAQRAARLRGCWCWSGGFHPPLPPQLPTLTKPFPSTRSNSARPPTWPPSTSPTARPLEGLWAAAPLRSPPSPRWVSRLHRLRG
jgi:hypothetical protein